MLQCGEGMRGRGAEVGRKGKQVPLLGVREVVGVGVAIGVGGSLAPGMGGTGTVAYGRCPWQVGP